MSVNLDHERATKR